MHFQSPNCEKSFQRWAQMDATSFRMMAQNSGKNKNINPTRNRVDKAYKKEPRYKQINWTDCELERRSGPIYAMFSGLACMYCICVYVDIHIMMHNAFQYLLLVLLLCHTSDPYRVPDATALWGRRYEAKPLKFDNNESLLLMIILVLLRLLRFLRLKNKLEKILNSSWTMVLEGLRPPKPPPLASAFGIVRRSSASPFGRFLNHHQFVEPLKIKERKNKREREKERKKEQK